MTALGASCVFFFKKAHSHLLNLTLGFSSGIMLAASYFSLLKPALEQAQSLPWLVVSAGFLTGGLFIALSEKLFDILPKHFACKKRSFMLVASITIHNIPEGLAVGVAFGSLSFGDSPIPAILLATGIGLQNFPEGSAVSLPLRRDGYSRFKSFFIGQLSGFVELVAGVLGAVMVGFFTAILPFSLAFASGAMVFAVFKELIPEAESDGTLMPSIAGIFGFTIMMLLDVLLG